MSTCSGTVFPIEFTNTYRINRTKYTSPNFSRQISTVVARRSIGGGVVCAASISDGNLTSRSPSAAITPPQRSAADSMPDDDAKFPTSRTGSFLTCDGTIATHAGERLGRGIVCDAITTPIVNTSAYFFKKTSDLIDFKEGRHASFEYGRYGNPTTVVAEEKISALEGAESTLLVASGICVTTVTFLALVPAGGHIVTTTDCFRKTRIFIEIQPPWLQKKRLVH